MDSAWAVSCSSCGQVEIFESTMRSFGCVCTARRLSILPVEKSSITTTALPSLSKRSTRWEPIKPAPPVTRMGLDLPLCGVNWSLVSAGGFPPADLCFRTDELRTRDLFPWLLLGQGAENSGGVLADLNRKDPGRRLEHGRLLQPIPADRAGRQSAALPPGSTDNRLRPA